MELSTITTAIEALEARPTQGLRKAVRAHVKHVQESNPDSHKQQMWRANYLSRARKALGSEK